MTTRGAPDNVWRAGGPLIRLSLLVPPVVALLLGAWIASEAATSTATGLDPANRGWFFLLVIPAQLVVVVIASTELASWYFGFALLPTWARRIIRPPWQARRVSQVAPPNGLSLLRTLASALGLAVGGSWIVLLAVPVQVLLTTWLVARPDLYSGPEKLVVGVETAAAIAWLAYLVRGLRRHRSER